MSTERKTPTITARVREEIGTHGSSAIRAEGEVPGVIYGHKESNTAIAMSGHDLNMLLRAKPLLVKIDLKGGQSQHAVIKEIQHSLYGSDVKHIDFQRVRLDEEVSVKVPLETYGTPIGAERGGHLELLYPMVPLRIRADSIPEKFVVNISQLNVNEGIKAKELPLPQGATLLVNPEYMVCLISTKKRKEEVPVAAAAAPAEGEAAAGAEGAAAAPADGKAADAKAGDKGKTPAADAKGAKGKEK